MATVISPADDIADEMPPEHDAQDAHRRAENDRAAERQRPHLRRRKHRRRYRPEGLASFARHERAIPLAGSARPPPGLAMKICLRIDDDPKTNP
jgi:hypothetical protein